MTETLKKPDLQMHSSYDNVVNATHARGDSMLTDKENISTYALNTPTFDKMIKSTFPDDSTSRGSPACSSCIGTGKREASIDTLSGYSVEQNHERLAKQLKRLEKKLKYEQADKSLIRNTQQDEIHVEVQDLPFDPAFVNVKPAEEVASSVENISAMKPRLKWCANCKAFVATYIVTQSTNKTFLSSLAICLIGGWCGCFVIPYYLEWGKLKNRVCKRCHKLVA